MLKIEPRSGQGGPLTPKRSTLGMVMDGPVTQYLKDVSLTWCVATPGTNLSDTK